MKPKVYVSIDWDFFIRMPSPNDKTSTSRGEIPNVFLYDWGAGESDMISQVQNAIWETRAHSFRQMGLNLESEFTLGDTTPEQVLSLFDLGFADRRFMVSHAGAIRHLLDLSHDGPFHVVSFDSHHDLGYSPSQTKDAEEGTVDCGSWLYAALYHEFACEATIVLPDWLEDQEIPDTNFNVSAVSFADTPEIKGEVAGLFVARSDSWAPPYLDREFMRMCELAGFDPNEFDGEIFRPWKQQT